MMGADRLQHVQYPQQGCIAFSSSSGRRSEALAQAWSVTFNRRVSKRRPLASSRSRPAGHFGLEPGYRLAEVVRSPTSVAIQRRRAVQRQPQGLGGPSPTASAARAPAPSGPPRPHPAGVPANHGQPLIALGPEVVAMRHPCQKSRAFPSTFHPCLQPRPILNCGYPAITAGPWTCHISADSLPQGDPTEKKKMPLFGHRFQPSLGARTGP